MVIKSTTLEDQETDWYSMTHVAINYSNVDAVGSIQKIGPEKNIFVIPYGEIMEIRFEFANSLLLEYQASSSV